VTFEVLLYVAVNFSDYKLTKACNFRSPRHKKDQKYSKFYLFS